MMLLYKQVKKVACFTSGHKNKAGLIIAVGPTLNIYYKIYIEIRVFKLQTIQNTTVLGHNADYISFNIFIFLWI